MSHLASSQLNKKHLEDAQRAVTAILKKHKMTIKKVLRLGPRYYVGDGMYRGKRAVLKMCLYTSSVDFLTNEKFKREVLFMRFLKTSRHALLKRLAPLLYQSGLEPRAWYIREYVGGQVQSINDGNVLYRPTFFTRERVKWIVNCFSSLQSIKKSELPDKFVSLLYKPDFTRQLLKYMNPHWKRVEASLRWSGLSRILKRYFNSNRRLYNTAPRVFVHQEPYASAFIKQGSRWRLIDWENIGWGNPLHDYIVLWMRASQYPDWQEMLRTSARKRIKLATFDQLWDMEALIQSVFNVISWHFYKPKSDLRELFEFSRKNIKRILTSETYAR